MTTPRATVIGVASALLLAPVLAAAGPRAPACGTTITGAIKLKVDRVCPVGHGLVVKGGAALDCAGHRLTGGGRSGQYGIYVRDGANAVVRRCVVEGFEVGIRLRNASTATVSDSTVRNNLRYGIEVTQGSTRARIERNRIHDNGDEGVHLSGPDDGDASHEILDNEVEGNAAEGIYLLGSHGNLISGNAIRDHGAAGIYVKGSARNVIDSNTLVNDPLHIVYGSQQNVVIDTVIEGHQIRFKEAGNNDVYNLVVRGDRGRPSVAYDFMSASDNRVAESGTTAPADFDIRATAHSKNNVFTRFAPSAALHCLVDQTSSVTVTGESGSPLACGQ